MKIIDEDTVKYHGLNGKSEDYKEGYFDAMAAHDTAPTVINNIVKLRPKTDDVIVISYNMQTLSSVEMKKIHEMIKNNFPINKIIGLPDTVSMECCGESILRKYIEVIGNAILNPKY